MGLHAFWGQEVNPRASFNFELLTREKTRSCIPPCLSKKAALPEKRGKKGTKNCLLIQRKMNFHRLSGKELRYALKRTASLSPVHGRGERGTIQLPNGASAHSFAERESIQTKKKKHEQPNNPRWREVGG